MKIAYAVCTFVGVGFFLFMGVSMALRAYGLIEPWGIFTEDTTLTDQWESPWHVLWSVLWLAYGAFFLGDRK